MNKRTATIETVQAMMDQTAAGMLAGFKVLFKIDPDRFSAEVYNSLQRLYAEVPEVVEEYPPPEFFVYSLAMVGYVRILELVPEWCEEFGYTLGPIELESD